MNSKKQLIKLIQEAVDAALQGTAEGRFTRMERKRREIELSNSRDIMINQGRINVIRKLAFAIKDLKLRATILENHIHKALQTQDLSYFRENLIRIGEGLNSFEEKDIPKAIQEYLRVIKEYKLQRDEETSVENGDKPN